MPIVLNRKTRVDVSTASDEVVTFLFPPMADPAFRAAIDELGAESFKMERRGRRGVTFEDHSTEAAVAFFDEYCEDIEGDMLLWDFGEEGEEDLRPLTEHADWINLLDTSWKVATAGYFRQKAVLEGEEAKN